MTALSGPVVRLSDTIAFANTAPLVLIGGMNVIEDRAILLDVAAQFVETTRDLGIPFVFKVSFDKANRSSIHSFRGPGLARGLELLAEIKALHGVPILTDVHELGQAAPVAEVADVLQLPAFLARQTDLVVAIARTGKVINVKKPQFLAPAEMRHIITKCAEAGNTRVLLCERGTSFGYNNLVVDMLGMDLMRAMAPVVFDVTHALQRRGDQAAALARAGVAVGIAGLFLEAHPDPSKALCDGPSALPLAALRGFLEQVRTIDRAVKPLLAPPPASAD
jgi:2-dehydro-3-deoxyphosphooctonate aldolase (KDO 8-P synthase)